MSDQKKTQHVDAAEGYRRWADKYDTTDNPMVAMVETVFDDFVGAVQDQPVVEFGCGTGRNLARLVDLGASGGHGYDLSPEMLNVARSKLDDRFNLTSHDITTSTDDEGDTYHLALFSLVLEHIESIEAPLAEAHRLTKPGGHLVVFELHPYLCIDGVVAHFDDDGVEIRLPSHPHMLSDFINTTDKVGWELVDLAEFFPNDESVTRNAKTARRGQVPWLWAGRWRKG